MLGVAVHWTVTPAKDNHAGCIQDWQNVINQHAAQGYNPAPAYNWGVCPHGVRMTGRTWGQLSAANGTNAANRDYWAIVALNAPSDVPTPELLTGLATLIDEAPDLTSRTVRPHSDFYATACCGDEIRAWIASGAQAPNTPPEDDTMKSGLFQPNGAGPVWLYDPQSHTKAWVQSPAALASLQLILQANGASADVHTEAGWAALIADAVDLRAEGAVGGQSGPLNITLTGTGIPA